MQVPVVNIAKEMNIKTIVFDKNTSCLAKKEADYFDDIDISNKEACLNKAKEYKNNNKLDGVITVGTDFSRVVSFISDELNLHSVPYEIACNASIKSQMRTLFKKNGVSCVNFKEVDINNISDQGLDYPLVIKPIDNMGARGVQLIYKQEDLDKAVKMALEFSNKAIIEEYTTFQEYSIDSIIYNDKIILRGFALRHIKYLPNFIEVGHTLPSDLDQEELNIVLDEFTRAIKALGINKGVAKGDIFYDKKSKKVLIGEIAARLSGGYMSGWTYPQATGVSVIKDAILMALGQEPELKEEFKKFTSAERALISIDGIVKDIKILDYSDLKVEHDKNIFLSIKKGSKVVFPRNNLEKCGNVIISAENKNVAINQSELIISNYLIELESSNIDTKNYFLKNFKHKAYNNLFNQLKEIGIKKTGNFDYKINVLVIKEDEKDFNFKELSKTLKIIENEGILSFKNESEYNEYDLLFYYCLSIASYQGYKFFLNDVIKDISYYFNNIKI